jgi:hypothetical protein
MFVRVVIRVVIVGNIAVNENIRFMSCSLMYCIYKYILGDLLCQATMYTAKPAYAVICNKRSHFACPVIKNVM